MLILYGLKNCDTCRKACRWLDANSSNYCFRDVRSEDVTEAKICAWADQVGWEVLLNRRSTTWRRLPDANQAIDFAAAIALMTRYPALIKRPVLEAGERVLVGFREAEYQSLL